MNTREFTSNDNSFPSNLQQSNSILASTHTRHLSPKRKTGEIITQVFETPQLNISPRVRKSSPRTKTCLSPQKVQSPSKSSSPQRSNSPNRLPLPGQQTAAGTINLIPIQNPNIGSVCGSVSESNYESFNKPLCYPNSQDPILQPDLEGIKESPNISQQGFQDKYSVSSSFIPNSFKGEDYKGSQTITTLDYSPTRQKHFQHSPVRHDWQQHIEEQLELFQTVQAQPEWHQPLQGKPLWHQNLMAQSQFNIQTDSQQQQQIQQQQQQQQQQQSLESKNSPFIHTQSLFDSVQYNSHHKTSKEEEDNKDISMNNYPRQFPQDFAISLPVSQLNTSRSGNQSTANVSSANVQLNQPKSQQENSQKQELKDTLISSKITGKQTVDKLNNITNSKSIPQYQVNVPEALESITQYPRPAPFIKQASPSISSKAIQKVSFDLNQSDESKSRNTSKSNISSVKSPQLSDWIDPEAIESYLKKSFSKDQRKQLIERLSKQIQSEEDEESQSQEGWSVVQPQGNNEIEENNSFQSLSKKTKKNLNIENNNSQQHYQLLRVDNNEDQQDFYEKNNQKFNFNQNLDALIVGQNTPQWDDGSRFSAENKQSFSVNQRSSKIQENADQDRNNSQNKGQSSSHKDSSASQIKGKEKQLNQNEESNNKHKQSSKLAEQVEISKESKLLLQEIYLEVQTALQKYDGKVQDSYSKGNQQSYQLNGSVVESQASSSIPSSPLIKNKNQNSVNLYDDAHVINKSNIEQLLESPKKDNISTKTSNEDNNIKNNKSLASSKGRSPAGLQQQPVLKQTTKQLRQSISLTKSEDKKGDQIMKYSTKQSFEGKIDKSELLLSKSPEQKDGQDNKKTKTSKQLLSKGQNRQSEQVLSSTRRLSQPNIQAQQKNTTFKTHNRRSSEATTGMLNGLNIMRNTDNLKSSVVRISKLREDQAEVAFNSRKLEIFKSLTSSKQKKNSIIQQKPMKHSNQNPALISNCSSHTNSKQLILSSNNNITGNNTSHHSRTPSGYVSQSFGEAQKQMLDTSLSNKQRTSIVLSRFFSPKCNQQSTSQLKAISSAAQQKEFNEIVSKKIKNHQSPKSFLSKQSSRAVSPAEQVVRSSSIEQEITKQYNNLVDTSQLSSDENDNVVQMNFTQVIPPKVKNNQTSNISLRESQLRLTLQLSKEKSIDQKKKIQEKKAKVRQLFDEVEDKFRRGEEQLSPTLKRNSSIPVSDDRFYQSQDRASCSPASSLCNIYSDAQRDQPDKKQSMNNCSPVQQFHHSLQLKKQEIIGDIQLLERRIELEGQLPNNHNRQSKKSFSQDFMEKNEGNRRQSKVVEQLVGQLQKKQQNNVSNSESKKSNIINGNGQQLFPRKISMDQLQMQQNQKVNHIKDIKNQLLGAASPQYKGFSIIDQGQSKKKETTSRQPTPKIPLSQVKSGSDLNEGDQTFLQNEEDIYSINQCHSAEYHLEMIAGSNNQTNNQNTSKNTITGGKNKTTLKDSNNKHNNITATLNSKDKMDQLQKQKNQIKQDSIHQDNNDSFGRIDVENVNLYRKQQPHQIPQRQHTQTPSYQRQPSANRISTEGQDKREDDGVNINVYRNSQSPNGRQRFADKDKIWMEHRKNLIAKTHKTVATTITTNADEECTFSPQINHKKARTMHSPASYYPAEKNNGKQLLTKKVSPSTVHISSNNHETYEEMHQINTQQLPIEVEFWSQSDASVYKAINDIDNTSNQGDLKKEITDLLDIITDYKSNDQNKATLNKNIKGVSPTKPITSQTFDKPKSNPSKITPNNNQFILGETLKNQLRTSYLKKVNHQQSASTGVNNQKKHKE